MKKTTVGVYATDKGRELMRVDTQGTNGYHYYVSVASVNREELAALGEAIADALKDDETAKEATV